MNKLSNINESGIVSQLNRHLAGKTERKCKISMEGVNNSHAFTDANGDTHYGGYGIINDGDSLTLRRLIAKIVDERGYECSLNDIDVSNIKDFSCMFAPVARFAGKRFISNDLSPLNKFKGDISGWDMSGAKILKDMFEKSEFNGDISKWDVSNVTSMRGMFNQSKFNGDISGWNVSKVSNFRLMFYLSSFNGDISNWDVSGTEDMSYMFKDSSFSKDLSKWNVGERIIVEKMFEGSKVKDYPEWYRSNRTSRITEGIMSQLNRHLAGKIERKSMIVDIPGVDNHHTFTDKNGNIHYNGYKCLDYSANVNTLRKLIFNLVSIRGNNCDLNDIDISNMNSLSGVFKKGLGGYFEDSFDLSSFNGDISGWDTSRVLYFNKTFEGSHFNGDISKWDVSRATEMKSMFKDSDFSGDISGWNTRRVGEFESMFEGSQFNGDISNWDVKKAKTMKNMFFNSNFSGDLSKWEPSDNCFTFYMFKGSPLQSNRPEWFNRIIRYRKENKLRVFDDE